MRQSGFTLLELIITIIILGMLSASALPRLNDLGSDARSATIQQMKAVIETSSKMANMKCRISRDCNDRAWGPVQTLDGMGFCLLEGWFDGGTNPGIGNCAIDMYINYNPNDWEVATPNTFEHHFRLRNAANPAACYAAYRQPDASGDVPEYLMDTSGC